MIIKDFLSGGVFKLAPTGYMAAVLRDGKPHTNAGKMSCEVVITTQDEDRSGDIVITKGIDLSDHRRNPVALLNHDKDAPIGAFEDRLGNYTVRMRGDNQLVGEIFFHQNSELACDVFRAIENKVFRGVSIGFMPVLGKVEKRSNRGHVYHASKMVEASILSIGDNQNAVIEAVHKGFGGKPLCAPLLSILRQQVPDNIPEFVTSGWDAEAIAKAGTYKMAEPKECEAQYRPSMYYICPHCGAEMSNESIFKDEDGTTRHGPCRGAVVLKEPTPQEAQPIIGSAPNPSSMLTVIKPVMPKAYKPSPRFLPGLRRKAMQPYDDDTMAGSYSDDGGMDDEFMPVDDDGLGDEGDSGPAMKSGAEAHHGVHDIIMQALSFIEDSGDTVDNATAKKTLDKVSKWLNKALAALHEGHSAYLSEHPDQPPLPGQSPLGENNDIEDAELEDDLSDDDSDTTSEDDDEEEDDDETMKRIADWRRKAIDSYWESVKRKAVVGDSPIVKSAIATFASIRDDKQVPLVRRKAAKAEVKALSGLLTKGVKAETADAQLPHSDEWDAFFNATEGTMN